MNHVTGCIPPSSEWSGTDFPPADYPRYRETIGPNDQPFQGRYDNLLLRPGLLMMIRDLVTLRDIRGEKESGPAIHVGIMLEGTGQSWIRGTNRLFTFQPGQMSLMTTSRPVQGAFFLPGANRVRLIDIRFERAFLGAILRDAPLLTEHDVLPETVLDGNGVQLTYMPQTVAIKRIAAQIMGADGDDPCDRLLLEGKAIEILSLAMTELSKRRHSTDPARPRPKPLSTNDRQRIQAAHDILLSDLESTPGLKNLARQVGLNENKLKYGFRQMFGNSVYATLQERRMQAAALMLADGGASVTDVALAVGYVNPAHFAKIFQRYYGTAPSQYGRAAHRQSFSINSGSPPMRA